MYVGTADADNASSFAVTSNEQPLSSDDPAVSVLQQMTYDVAGVFLEVFRFIKLSGDPAKIITELSAYLLGAAARKGRADLIRPGAMRAVCMCMCCGKDRTGASLSDSSLLIKLPGYLRHVDPVFQLLAQIVEAAANGVLAEVAFPQLRRLRQEIVNLAAVLPDAPPIPLAEGKEYDGPLYEGTVLYAKPPAWQTPEKTLCDIIETLFHP